MTQHNQSAYAALLLRLAFGIVILAHSVYLKLFIFTLPGTVNFFASLGLPAVLAYLVFGIEAIGGIALLLGFKTRIVSIVLIPILLGATWVHLPNGWLFTNADGGWEYPLLLVAIAIVQCLIGDGAYLLNKQAVKA